MAFSKIPEYLRDHTFGDLDDLSVGAPFLSERLRGVHHFGRKTPLVPKPGEAVTLYAYTSSDLPVKDLWLRFSINDWRDYTEIPFEPAKPGWDTLLWGWINEWRAQLPAQPEGTFLRYQVYARLPGIDVGSLEDKFLYADNLSADAGTADQFAIWYGEDSLPEWSRSARIYQVFVDRFSQGEGRGGCSRKI